MAFPFVGCRGGVAFVGCDFYIKRVNRAFSDGAIAHAFCAGRRDRVARRVGVDARTMAVISFAADRDITDAKGERQLGRTIAVDALRTAASRVHGDLAAVE